jgi:NAD-specific glutamate dehydrogenase
MDYFTRMVVDSNNREYLMDELEEENFKNGDRERDLTITDQFGFIEKTIESGMQISLPELGSAESQERLSQKALKMMKKENARVFKWKEMLDEYPEKKNAKLKTRARKGIPDALRGYAWQVLIQGAKYLDGANSGGSGQTGPKA